MSDLFRDFLVWLMGFTGCSVLVFAAACYARNKFKSWQKQVNRKQTEETDSSSSAADAQLSPKFKWLVFALAPVFYLLLLGPALSELNTHFQKIQSGRAVLAQIADIPQTIEPVPDSIGTRGLARNGFQITKNLLHRTSSCFCRKTDGQETPTQETKQDAPSDLDDSGWEASPGWQLSTGDRNEVAEGDVAEMEQFDQID